jgi:hypothetical protein
MDYPITNQVPESSRLQNSCFFDDKKFQHQQTEVSDSDRIVSGETTRLHIFPPVFFSFMANPDIRDILNLAKATI